MQIQYAIAFVSDMSAAVGFYRDVCGLPLRFESPGWSEFESGGATLALHATPGPAVLRPEGDTPAGAVQIGFRVDDVAAFHARMLEHGVVCAREPVELHGATLASYVGPDGAVFGVSAPLAEPQ